LLKISLQSSSIANDLTKYEYQPIGYESYELLIATLDALVISETTPKLPAKQLESIIIHALIPK